MNSPTLSRRAGLLALAWLAASALAAADFPPFSEAEYHAAGFGPKEPRLVIEYPGLAATKGIAEGSATVSVLVDADGKAVDFLVTKCSLGIFGAVLEDRLRVLAYQPARFRGKAVPARFSFTYDFVSPTTGLSAAEASRARGRLGRDERAAIAENKLAHELEFTAASLPTLPAGVAAPSGAPLRVFVTFFVDEEGRVRIPSVDSAPDPRLVAPALDAVLRWSFKPPQHQGKPALVFAGRAVRFLPPKVSGRTPSAIAQAGL